MIPTLIVEDDFRVAGAARRGRRARCRLRVVGAGPHRERGAVGRYRATGPTSCCSISILPTRRGLELLRRVRAVTEPPDVMVLTAARDMASVPPAMRYGALRVPDQAVRLRAAARSSWSAYAERRARSAGDGETDQVERRRPARVDARRAASVGSRCPKGLSPATAGLILGALEHAPGPLSASELADEVGLSRATVQRYLAQLADDGSVERTLRYGSTGRPEHRYHVGSGPPV